MYFYPYHSDYEDPIRTSVKNVDLQKPRLSRNGISFRMGRNGSESSDRCVDMKHFYSDRILVHVNTGIVGSLNIKSSKLKEILSRARHDGSSDVRQKDRLTRVSLPGIGIGKSITGQHLKLFFQLYLLERRC